MEVNEAVKAAKEYIRHVFEAETLSNVGLEEVEFDDTRDQWVVTIGFSRLWDQPPEFMKKINAESRRDYKTVRINDVTGEAVSVKNREMVR